MEEFEIVEHVPDKSGKGFSVIAIDFNGPKFVKINAVEEPKAYTTIKIDGDKALYGEKQIGRVTDRKDSSEVRISTKYDIKYTGGYSLDGKTVYLDEHFPKKLMVEGKEISAEESIGFHHELPEKWMSDIGYEYPHAHEIATGIEKKYVESQGVTWKGYCTEVDKNLRLVYRNKLEKSPPSLDLAPYLYCRDREALKEIRESK
ncbi:MAG: hypothetical protein M1518_00365 [Candidatus Thermoplasmatota archaeon]|jgi:hypothetical protein|nr:hypothetical protein [Candidatus Thermoplasmatota archaeon]